MYTLSFPLSAGCSARARLLVLSGVATGEALDLLVVAFFFSVCGLGPGFFFSGVFAVGLTTVDFTTFSLLFVILSLFSLSDSDF